MCLTARGDHLDLQVDVQHVVVVLADQPAGADRGLEEHVSEVPALTVELHLTGRVDQHHRLRTGPALRRTRAAGQPSEDGERQRQGPTRGADGGAKDTETGGRECPEGTLAPKSKKEPLGAVITRAG